MSAVIFILAALIAAGAIAMNRMPLWAWGVWLAVVTLGILSGGLTGDVGAPGFGLTTIIALLPAIALLAISYPPIRRIAVIQPAFGIVKKVLPPVSETEQAALDAGTVGWDAQLFSGTPDWSQLREIPGIEMTAEEQAFLDGPTNALCDMIDDWKIRHEEKEIPKEIWDFVRENGFLGMLISKEHGGLGFSAQAQSIILGRIASRSPDVSTIVMVPNSLGPGELIEKYGTDEQKDHYLPRLADGTEIPAFGLTGTHSGSDAASMRDVGVICKYNSDEALGIRLNWSKRYISLGPKATILGLAFEAQDPDGLLGDEKNPGITLALIPTDHEGVHIGDRHLPSGSAFPNGPNWGEDVMIPIEWVIGGKQNVGNGWRMLMECLSAGRAISLPASGTAGAKMMLRLTTAYAQIRKQFGIAIAKMEGVEERITRIAEAAYLLESSRSVTASMVSRGEKPAVISALLKYQSTEWMRLAVNDAMDVHGGRAVIDGPSNYLQSAHQMVPVGITVEGANILTRSLITFSQGALRAHPYLYKEVSAAQNPDRAQGLRQFEDAFCGHVSFAVSNIFGAPFHNLTFAQFASAPDHAKTTARWYRKLSRASRNFALVADLTVALLGGDLKRKQKVTGRLADALSELYMVSCLLKRFEDDGRPAADRPILDYCVQNALYRFERAMAGTVDNFPIGWARITMRALVFPLGARYKPASDRLGRKVAKLALEPGEVRDRLTRFVHVSGDKEDSVGVMEYALPKVLAADEIAKKLDRGVRDGKFERFHGKDWIGAAVTAGVITDAEAETYRETDALIERAVRVDHFAAADLKPNYRNVRGANDDDPTTRVEAAE
ncbi:MAG: acyl-CoA dehydrogenase [Pseudomonadota bacterium]